MVMGDINVSAVTRTFKNVTVQCIFFLISKPRRVTNNVHTLIGRISPNISIDETTPAILHYSIVEHQPITFAVEQLSALIGSKRT